MERGSMSSLRMMLIVMVFTYESTRALHSVPSVEDGVSHEAEPCCAVDACCQIDTAITREEARRAAINGNRSFLKDIIVAVSLLEDGSIENLVHKSPKRVRRYLEALQTDDEEVLQQHEHDASTQVATLQYIIQWFDEEPTSLDEEEGVD